MHLQLTAADAELLDMALWHYVTRHEHRPGTVLAVDCDGMRDLLARVRDMVRAERRRMDSLVNSTDATGRRA